MAPRQAGAVGRPRGFDVEEALERAVLVFWEHGYEGATLSTLTAAMGISTTSMYAAFGNKEELFAKALDRYTEGPGAYLIRALKQPTALGVATEILDGTVRSTTRADRPHGCLGVQAGLATSSSGDTVRDTLTAWRTNGCASVGQRLRRAAEEEDLPSHTDPDLLARYLTTLSFGIAVQAASGVGRDELQELADAALQNWPLL
jgi:AcrR family transcriptional regulator